MDLFVLILFRAVFLNDEVVDDEVLALHRVLAHVIFEELLHLIVLMEGHLLQSDVRTNEAGKLIW